MHVYIHVHEIDGNSYHEQRGSEFADSYRLISCTGCTWIHSSTMPIAPFQKRTQNCVKNQGSPCLGFTAWVSPRARIPFSLERYERSKSLTKDMKRRGLQWKLLTDLGTAPPYSLCIFEECTLLLLRHLIKISAPIDHACLEAHRTYQLLSWACYPSYSPPTWLHTGQLPQLYVGLQAQLQAVT